MIRKPNLELTVPLAELYSNTNLTITAKPNTVLSELNRFAELPADDISLDSNLDDADKLQNSFQMIENITSGTSDEVNQHCLQLDGVVRDLSTLVTAHIGFAKNVVKPLVVKFAEDIHRYVETYNPKDPAESIELISYDLPELLTDSSFLDSLSGYEGKPAIHPDKLFGLAAKSHEELLPMITYSNDRINKLVALWESSLPENFLLNVYTSLFTTEVPESKVTFEKIEASNGYDKINYGVAIYLLSSKLLLEVEDPVSGSLGKVEYDGIMNHFKEYGSVIILQGLAKVKFYSTSKTVIIEQSYTKLTAKLHGPVYKEFLSSGGSLECILGAISSDRRFSSLTALTAEQEDLLSSWKTFYNFKRSNQSVVFFQQWKEFLLATLLSSLSDLSEDEKALMLKDNSFINKIDNIAKREIEELKMFDVSDHFGTALKLIGKARFHYSSAYFILNTIMEASVLQPDINVREAATIAAVYYLTDYLTDQIAIG